MTHAFTLALDQNYLKLQKAAILHIEGGSKEVALKSAQKFLTNYPQEAEANYNMARALVRLEKQHLALDYAELANKLKPNRAQYVFLLGRLYLNFAMYEYAAPLLREAVLKLPDNLLIQWAMADYQFALNNGPLARLHYEKALLLTPDQEQLPYILCDYAKCLTTIGDKEEARKTYTKLATIKSFEMIALVKLSVLEKYKPDSEIAERLRASLDHKELDILCRSEILLSLGNMHENVGEYNAAFEYWTQSRSLKIISGEHDIGNREYINITQFYSPKLLSAAEQYGHKSERPVFVVGMPRSGTT